MALCNKVKLWLSCCIANDTPRVGSAVLTTPQMKRREPHLMHINRTDHKLAKLVPLLLSVTAVCYKPINTSRNTIHPCMNARGARAPANRMNWRRCVPHPRQSLKVRRAPQHGTQCCESMMQAKITPEPEPASRRLTGTDQRAK